ncbi:ATP-binding protein [Kiritimatiella glycovorans]|uniref:histidine kinase n=1 Tax=Kiritimatiella glycovorans TaxID=1307763 RepID=A0A0G3EMK1_9BACT|nr:ATP-binding protein [Kiritimatiella glycovorans]AKJ65334.1 Sensor histidine kinase [Kiritimatiella glycovorans]
MNFFHFSILSATITVFALGLLVFFTNSGRRANRRYLLFSVIIALWLFCQWMVLNAQEAEDAEFWIRQASRVCILVPTAFFLLRLSLLDESEGFWHSVRRSGIFILVNLLAALLCGTDLFIREVVLTRDTELNVVFAEPRYGPLFHLFSLMYIALVAVLIRHFIRDIRSTKSIRQVELKFVCLGAIVGISTGITLGIIIPAISGSSKTAPLAPYGVILLNVIIAYGIATHRIMDVSHLLQRALGYIVLSAYLAVIFLFSWWVADLLFTGWFAMPDIVACCVAAVVTAIFAPPLKDRVHRMTGKLFDDAGNIDTAELMRRASDLLRTVSTLPSLLNQASGLVLRTMDAERGMFLFRQPDGFYRPPPELKEENPLELAEDSPVVRVLSQQRRPLVPEIEGRLRTTEQRAAACAELQALGMAIGIGIYSKGYLRGMLLLGPRRSERIYGSPEQNALQSLCNQFAVAVENAQLYTEVQNSKIYNDFLVEHLVTGVAATDSRGRVSIFNREAERITGVPSSALLGSPCSELPEPLNEFMEETLATGKGRRDCDTLIRSTADEEYHLRLGAAVITGRGEARLGGLLVFHDVSAVHRLQQQVRRSDRLASAGTLAAGMAHEIKNPLVTIKTFTQLLPERYEDPDFRRNFSELVGHEVGRIDNTVNQLLRFARPQPPHLVPVHLQEILQRVQSLVAENMKQKGIESRTRWEASNDLIRGDASLLIQAFLNFCLNAIEAMEKGGVLSMETRNERRDGRPAVRVEIADTGCGIPREDVPRIFDPFFTGKDEGTGLGLPVAHGIIKDHQGEVEVRSAQGEGTSFFISFETVNEGDPDS